MAQNQSIINEKDVFHLGMEPSHPQSRGTGVKEASGAHFRPKEGANKAPESLCMGVDRVSEVT